MKCDTKLKRRYPNDKEMISFYPGVLSSTPPQEKGGQRRGRVGFRVRTKLSLRASPRASHRGVGGFRTPLPNDDWKDKAGSESQMTTQGILLCSSGKFLLSWVKLFLRLSKGNYSSFDCCARKTFLGVWEQKR